MGKFNELCTLQQAAFNRYAEYEQCCYIFADNFFGGLRKYLDCPEGAIKFHVSGQQEDVRGECPLHQALIRQNDGFYEVYFSLTLSNEDIQDIILVSCKIKKAADHYTVRIGMQRKDFEVAGSDDLMNIYDHIYSTIKNYYDQDGYMKPTCNIIGFIV